MSGMDEGMRLNDEELELVSIARGQSIDEMVAVVEHIVAARMAEAWDEGFTAAWDINPYREPKG